MTAEAKSVARKREPALIPIGYSTQKIRQRATRPLHSRAAVLEAAEAVFKPKARESDKLHDVRPKLSRWPQLRTTARLVPDQLSGDGDAGQ
jgi:hypothetical protein